MAMTQILKLRISDNELSAIDAKAQELGLNRSDFIRLASSLAISVSTSPGATVAIDTKRFHKIYRELNRWGINYNQGIKALNSTARSLKKAVLNDNDKAHIALQSKNAYGLLTQSKEGILNVNIQLLALAADTKVSIQPRLLAALDSLDGE